MTSLARFIPVLPRSVWYAVLFGLIVHLAGLSYVLATVSDADALVWGDGKRYVELAERLVAGEGFVYESADGLVAETLRTPAVPFLIACFLAVGLGLGGYLFFLTTVSAVAIPLLVWFIFRDWFPSRAVVLAVWLATIEPLMWLNSWFPLSEIPFLICSLCAVYFIKRAVQLGDWDWGLWAGIMVALALLVRPACVPLFGVLLAAVCVYSVIYARHLLPTLGIIIVVTGITLLPWIIWMHAHTGAYALSGTGWRNIYTDYLASVRAVESGTVFADEKRKLKESAMERWNLSIAGLDDPANAALFRDYALAELRDHKMTVLKIQAITFVSYFTHTDYLYRLARLELAPTVISELSASQVLIREGIEGVPKVFREMSRKFFMPLFERVWTSLLFVGALVGWWRGRRSRIVWLIVAVIAVGYLTSSAIGTGVEGRLRIPVLPYYFLLVGLGATTVIDWLQRRRHTTS